MILMLIPHKSFSFETDVLVSRPSCLGRDVGMSTPGKAIERAFRESEGRALEQTFGNSHDICVHEPNMQIYVTVWEPRLRSGRRPCLTVRIRQTAFLQTTKMFNRKTISRKFGICANSNVMEVPPSSSSVFSGFFMKYIIQLWGYPMSCCAANHLLAPWD